MDPGGVVNGRWRRKRGKKEEWRKSRAGCGQATAGNRELMPELATKSGGDQMDVEKNGESESHIPTEI
jgi:hypothetical protein